MSITVQLTYATKEDHKCVGKDEISNNANITNVSIKTYVIKSEREFASNDFLTVLTRIQLHRNTGNRCASPEPLNHWSKHAQLPVLLLLRRHT